MRAQDAADRRPAFAETEGQPVPDVAADELDECVLGGTVEPGDLEGRQPEAARSRTDQQFLFVNDHCDEVRTRLFREDLDGREHWTLNDSVYARPTLADFGPFVVPGRTSCLRCADLTRCDFEPVLTLMSSMLPTNDDLFGRGVMTVGLRQTP